jgi:hypothetical protein
MKSIRFGPSVGNIPSRDLPRFLKLELNRPGIRAAICEGMKNVPSTYREIQLTKTQYLTKEQTLESTNPVQQSSIFGTRGIPISLV